MRRALSIPLVAAALLLAFAAPAFAGESGTTVSLGGLSAGSGSTPAAPPASSASPGRSGRSGGSGGSGGSSGSHAPSGTQTTSTPPPSAYLYDGAPVCVGGVCTQFMTRNPACVTGGSCAAPPSGLTCATIHNAAAGAINGRQTCWITYSTPPTTVQVDAHIGYAWQAGIQPTTMGIARWVVNYEGQSYTYPGTWNLVTGNIQAVCDGQPTSGTVEFYLTPPSNPAYASPPAGWHWQSSPPAEPSLGPYSAGSFTVPACSPSRQQAIQSVTLEPSSNMEAAPTIQKMGTKEVLHQTRHLGWGSDTSLYRSVDELAEQLPARLSRLGRLVVKQGRGNGGNGVWSVELGEPHSPVTLSSPVLVREARTTDAGERLSLGEFVRRCDSYFSWSGVLVDQVYQPRLAEGMIRCYFSHGQVVGFCHQWPKGLLDAVPGAPTPERPPTVMEGPDTPAYQRLRQRAEGEWVPEMIRVLGLEAPALPVIWDADFLYGPKDGHGSDSYVLCEINVSAVWPFPPMASTTIAANTVARIDEST